MPAFLLHCGTSIKSGGLDCVHVEMDPDGLVCNEYLKYTKRFLMIRRRYTTLVVYILGLVYIFSLAEAGRE